MSRTTMTAAFAAMLAASMPMAFAQSSSTGATGTTGTPPHATSAANQPSGDATSTPPAGDASASSKSASAQPANEVKPGEIRFTKLQGATVYGSDNKDIGSVDEVVLDHDGKVAAVVIKNGGFLGLGGKDVAVSMNNLKVTRDNNGNPRVSVAMTEDQLKSAQAYELNPKKNNNSTATGSSTPPASRPTPPASHTK